jgi:hypothetical protein
VLPKQAKFWLEALVSSERFFQRLIVNATAATRIEVSIRAPSHVIERE